MIMIRYGLSSGGVALFQGRGGNRRAHRINVEGTMQLLMMAAYRSEKYKKEVKFLFPSSIAAYGMGGIQSKKAAGRVKEDEYNTPQTMYGCNKLYCEKLGMYYSVITGSVILM